jgi:hypothetical protein
MSPHHVSLLSFITVLAAWAHQQTEIGIEQFLGQVVADASDGEAHGVKARLARIGTGSDAAYLAYIEGGGFCGMGGCPLLLLGSNDGVWEVRSKTTLVRLPVREVAGPPDKLPDISVTLAGGGQLEPQRVVLPFDGRGYAPNPSIAPAFPADPPGRVLISDATKQVAVGPR